MFADQLTRPFASLLKGRRRKDRQSLSARGNRRFEQLELRTVLSAAGWLTHVASPTDVGILDLLTDAEGNIYVAGGFEGTVDFAPNENITGDTLTTNVKFDPFVAKYNPDGTLGWVQSLDDRGTNSLANSIALQEVGDETVADTVYVALLNGEIWKLNGDDGSHGGSPIWADEGGSALELNEIVVDQATGDLAATGHFRGTFSTSSTVNGQAITHSSVGLYDAIVLKLDSDGLVYWAKRDGGYSDSEGFGVTLDDAGNVYATGRLNINKGPKDVRTNSGDVFVWKLDADGSEQWRQNAGSDDWDQGYDILLSDGGVYVTGDVGDPGAQFGEFQIPVVSDFFLHRGFVTKLDELTGEFLWVSTFLNDVSSDSSGSSLDLDSDGILYLTGTAVSGGSFGSLTLEDNTGPSRSFLATMDQGTGSYESVRRIGAMTDAGHDVLAIDGNDNLILGGYLLGDNQEFFTGDILSSTPNAEAKPSYDMVLGKLFANDPDNTDPTADVGGPYAGAEDATITFDASGSGDVDGDELAYSWDFGDGTTAITSSPTMDHAYQWGDTFSVSVTVSDGRGGSDTAVTTATVSEVNDAPVADAGGPYNGVVDEAVTLDASASFDPDNQDGTPTNDQVLEYLWDYDNDGTTDEITPTPTVDHAFATAGSHTVSLTVRDEDLATHTDAVIVTVTESPPATEVYIADISFDSRRGGNDWRAVIEVLTVDGSAPAAGVTLKVDFAGTTYELTTDSDGTARTEWHKKLDAGIYLTEAYDLALEDDDFTWTPLIHDLVDDDNGNNRPDEVLEVV